MLVVIHMALLVDIVIVIYRSFSVKKQRIVDIGTTCNPLLACVDCFIWRTVKLLCERKHETNKHI